MAAITVTVTAYTPRGMYALDRTQPISDEHRNVNGMDLLGLFRKNDPSTFIYSPFTDGFRGGYLYTIKIQEAGRGRFICNFVLDRRASAHALPNFNY